MGRKFMLALAMLCAVGCKARVQADVTIGGEDGTDHSPKIVTERSAEPLPFPGHTIDTLISVDDLPSGVSLHELIMEPRSLGAPPHVHENEDEVFIVMEGAVTFLNGETEVKAPAGTVASLPRGHFHGFWNPHDEPAKLLLFISPGEFSAFFDEVVMTIRKENPNAPDQVGAIIGRVAAEHGVTVDPSRFPPSALELMGPPPGE